MLVGRQEGHPAYEKLLQPSPVILPPPSGPRELLNPPYSNELRSSPVRPTYRYVGLVTFKLLGTKLELV